MSSLEEQLILYGGGAGAGAGDGLLFGAEAAEERIKSLLGEGERGGLMRRRVMRRPVGSAALSFGERDADGGALSPLAVADPLSDLLSHISASHAGGESRAHCPRRAAGLAHCDRPASPCRRAVVVRALLRGSLEGGPLDAEHVDPLGGGGQPRVAESTAEAAAGRGEVEGPGASVRRRGCE
ncbi:hypothetical protein EMIHUDRAFT_109942 [Emiliania huxleyi CCMP1516]|uniref:Uncharacterized protein n=2 Tax=Emiliania huxleyi TaxID=2903 RepID=A0A0D3KNH2_EMIH1|nr:hypothetical protein EMIHUDRAFT_109942 [Emiliania huxleyi CCMP1516]EOD37307.1 hypothetical protein EMIHUDRAFT_109942 [Emiliania huxleyi CCMP1516]|eukprot:XP_005789736.1 hypothetical protein EMIHUDRAFT_109942 [Emiliania huxleyi CCMP1516]